MAGIASKKERPFHKVLVAINYHHLLIAIDYYGIFG